MKSAFLARLVTAFTVFVAACALVAICVGERAAGQTDVSRAAKRVVVEQYKGPQIYLDEKQVIVSPALVRRDVFTDKFPDGTVRVERQIARYSDDHRESDGYYREFYPNGQKFIEGGYRLGKQHGDWSYYYDNGQLNRKVTYVDGRLNGAWDRFRADGTLASKSSYEDGRRHGTWQTFDATGKLLLQEENYSHGKADGTMKAWYADGKPKVQMEVKDGVRNGRTQQWDESGKLIADVTYVDGKLNGQATVVRPDGETIVQEYKDGLLISEGK